MSCTFLVKILTQRARLWVKPKAHGLLAQCKRDMQSPCECYSKLRYILAQEQLNGNIQKCLISKGLQPCRIKMGLPEVGVEISDPSELDALMDGDAYRAFLETEA